jgi:cell division protein FtsQ
MRRRDERRAPPLSGVSAPSDPRFRRADAALIRRRYVRAGVRRLVRGLAPAAIVLGLGLAVAQGLAVSGALQVREIVVTGHQTLSAGEVERLVTGLGQEQIFSVDLERYRQRLLESPWVADVHLTRVLPATIRIAVVERRPVAAARHDQQLYLVDKTGSIIGDYGPASGDLDLPIVSGLMVGGRTRQDEPRVDPAAAQLAGVLLTALSTRADLLSRVSEIEVSKPTDAVLLFDDDTAWLHVGDRDFAARLDHYLETRAALVERFGALDYVDLRFGERLFVRGQGRGRQMSAASHTRAE